MERTPEYWATIAQILPVLMLALVVEGRATARGLARKKRYPHNRKIRIAYAAIFLLNCFALYFALDTALDGAAGKALPTQRAWLADFALTLGVSTVFLTPILMVGSTLAGDWFATMYRRLPISRVARGIRRARAARDELDSIRREARDTFLQLRIEISRGYVDEYRRLSDSPADRGIHEAIDALDRDRKFVVDSEAKIHDKSTDAYKNISEIEGRQQLGEDDLRVLRSLLLSSALRN